MPDKSIITHLYRFGVRAQFRAVLSCGHTRTFTRDQIRDQQIFVGKLIACLECDPWSGKRIRTRVPDRNEVDRGEVDIPVGWTATVGDPQDGHYQILWDDGPDGDMGWCLWTPDELKKDAEVIS